MIIRTAKKITCLVLALVFLLSAVSCDYLRDFYGDETETTIDPEGTSSPDVTTADPSVTDDVTESAPIVTMPTPDIVYDHVNPYTGLPCKYDLKNSRAIAFVIDNTYLSAPQDGISNADILCEFFGSDGDTTLLAVCKNPEDGARMGPLGTANKVILDFAKCFDALVFSRNVTESMKIGQSAPSYLYTYEDDELPYGFFEASDRINEMGYKYSVIGEGARLFSLLESKGVTVTSKEDFADIFNFYSGDREYSLAGKTSNAVYIDVSSKQHIQLVYSPSEKVYFRYQFGTEPHKDAINDGAVAFKNVFLLSGVDNYSLPDDEIRLSVPNRGSGYFVCNGKYISISWVKDSAGAINFYKADGTELDVPAGKSYIGFFSPGMLSSVLLNGK